MSTLSKVILNISVGSEKSWYHRGQSALMDSLDAMGEKSTIYISRYSTPRFKSVYEDKIDHILSAGKHYDMILWLDCSITAVRPLDDIWDYIEENGAYLYQSGANCAQTCNDHCLRMYGLTRDEADKIPECASNVVGFNMNHPQGRAFYEAWMQSLSTGANVGYKWPNEYERISESIDPRFKYHRQDQSTASLAAHQAGIKLQPEGHFVARHENLQYHNQDQIIFVLKGGVGD